MIILPETLPSELTRPFNITPLSKKGKLRIISPLTLLILSLLCMILYFYKLHTDTLFLSVFLMFFSLLVVLFRHPYTNSLELNKQGIKAKYMLRQYSYNWPDIEHFDTISNGRAGWVLKVNLKNGEEQHLASFMDPIFNRKMSAADFIQQLNRYTKKYK